MSFFRPKEDLLKQEQLAFVLDSLVPIFESYKAEIMSLRDRVESLEQSKQREKLN